LFQNALDACRYRAARSKLAGVPYEPQISIFQGRTEAGREYVECHDNGVGMTRELLENCFAKAGNRFVSTLEFRQEMAAWNDADLEFFPNSQFGIGVFSYFIVAEELEVETGRLGLKGEPPTQRILARVPTASSFFRITTISHAEALQGLRGRIAEQGSLMPP